MSSILRELWLQLRWLFVGWEYRILYRDIYTMAAGSFAMGGIVVWAFCYVFQSDFSSRKTSGDVDNGN